MIEYSALNNKKFPKSCGVYAIYFKNSLKNKVYIGSASSTRIGGEGFKKRWGCHLSDLRKNKHDSIKLQLAYNKYGESNLIFTVIEESKSEECLELEQIYINLFNSYNFGYNSRPLASNQTGYKHNKKTKAKISKYYKLKRSAFKNKVIELYNKNYPCNRIAEELNICSGTVRKILKEEKKIKLKNRAYYIKIPIFCYSDDGVFIKRFESAYEAAQKLNIVESNIRRILKGSGLFILKKFFSYEKLSSEEALNIINNRKKEMHDRRSHSCKNRMTKERIEKMRLFNKGNNYRKKIENIKQYDLNNNLIKIWKNSKEIVSAFNLKNFSPILRVLKGDRKKFKNYIWKI